MANSRSSEAKNRRSQGRLFHSSKVYCALWAMTWSRSSSSSSTTGM